MPAPHADVAVIGGSGFYEFLEEPDDHAVPTPYGEVLVSIGQVAGRSVAFLPRHGPHHEHPPHRINYRANLWALRSVGVRQVLGPYAAGSLQPDLGPGALVLPDQLVDRTYRREQTYVQHGAAHMPYADPYCPRIAEHVLATEPDVIGGGTMVVIEGPRFSTRAESQWYAAQGWELVNMTAVPEAPLARELGMCFTALVLVTDHDAGVEAGQGVGQADVFRLFAENIDWLKEMLVRVIGGLPDPDGCTCASWMDDIELPYDLP